MKRFLSALLCAVLLPGLLPGAASAASEPLPGAAPERVGIRNASMSMSRVNACLGDKIEFEISGVEAEGDLYYRWAVYRDNGSAYEEVFQESTAVMYHPKFVYYPVALGAYYAEVYLADDINNEYYASDDFTVRLRAAPKITPVESVSGTSLKISWNKVAGAGGYEVWRSLSKAGEYKLVKTTTATSFSNTYLAAGTRYYYKIRTYNMVGTEKVLSSGFGAAQAGVPLAKSAIISATGVSGSQVKLTWTKVAQATGYQVLKSATAAGTYQSIKLTTALTYTVGGLQPSKTYYFKVRPYMKISTLIYYGPLSGYKSGRTK